MDVPDLAEPIVAYRYVDPYNLRSGDFGAVTARRTTRFTRREYLTTEIVIPVHWRDGQVTAKCPICESSPGKNCPITTGDGCGIYAYKFPYAETNVEVQLWGKVYEYEYGYRAEHAQISGIVKVTDRMFIVGNYGGLTAVLSDLPVRSFTTSTILNNELFRRWDWEENAGIETYRLRPEYGFNRRWGYSL